MLSFQKARNPGTFLQLTYVYILNWYIAVWHILWKITGAFLICWSYNYSTQIHGWHQPNVPGISGLGMMCLGIACLYAPIIMDHMAPIKKLSRRICSVCKVHDIFLWSLLKVFIILLVFLKLSIPFLYFIKLGIHYPYKFSV